MQEEPQYYVVPRLKDLKIGRPYRIVSVLHGIADNHETKYHSSGYFKLAMFFFIFTSYFVIGCMKFITFWSNI